MFWDYYLECHKNVINPSTASTLRSVYVSKINQPETLLVETRACVGIDSADTNSWLKPTRHYSFQVGLKIIYRSKIAYKLI